MTDGPGSVVPLRFDLSELVQRSVATMYSHLVTRPTGRALRIGIESQITELGALCISVLDFRQVVVLDYSCADETIAKLLQRFQQSDRPCEVYFVARGVSERHREPIEAVLKRQGLALVAEMDGESTLLGDVEAFELKVWRALEQLTHAGAPELLTVLSPASDENLEGALGVLERRRLIARVPGPTPYYSLIALSTRT
jgi:hypothetical protein